MLEKHGDIGQEYIQVLKEAFEKNDGMLLPEHIKYKNRLLEYGYVTSKGKITDEGKLAIEKGV